MIKTTKGLLEFWEEQMKQSHRSSNYFFRKSPSHYHMMLIVMSTFKSNKNIALCRIDIKYSELGTEVEVGKIDGHQKRIGAKVVAFPFYDPKKTKVRS